MGRRKLIYNERNWNAKTKLNDCKQKTLFNGNISINVTEYNLNSFKLIL